MTVRNLVLALALMAAGPVSAQSTDDVEEALRTYLGFSDCDRMFEISNVNIDTHWKIF